MQTEIQPPRLKFQNIHLQATVLSKGQYLGQTYQARIFEYLYIRKLHANSHDPFPIFVRIGGMGGAINAFIGWKTCNGGFGHRHIRRGRNTFYGFLQNILAFAIQAFWSETFKVKAHFMAFCKTD